MHAPGSDDEAWGGSGKLMADSRRPPTNDLPSTDRCLLYYITDRTAFAGNESTRCRRLLEKIAQAVRAGVDYIQLREKDLSTRQLEALAREAAEVADRVSSENRERKTALLINSRTDLALAAHADGVHLRSEDISPQEVREIWSRSSRADTSIRQAPIVGVSCHSPAEVGRAAAAAATFAVFAPVFEKKDAPTARPTGLAELEEACNASIPVLALGGVTVSNALSCLEAGAAGIAAIRLFQETHVASVAETLRNLKKSGL
jgi:thiamine-phosphate pyrophosphorylase